MSGAVDTSAAVILEYQRRTHFPTYIGNARLRVDDGGRVFVQVNREEPPLDHEWCDDYPAMPAATVSDARARSNALLTRHGFHSMAARTDDEYDDRQCEQLTYVSADGASRSVIVDRARVPAFRALVTDLASLLGIGDSLG